MIFNQKRRCLSSNITPVKMVSVEYVKEGCPVRSIKAIAKSIVLNDPAVLARQPTCNPHDLEIALDTGKDLKQVATKILSKNQLTDFEVNSNLKKLESKVKKETEIE